MDSSSAMPVRKPTAGAPQRQTPSREHANMWADGPLLRVPGAGYSGQRVVVEVWEDGRALSVMKGSPPPEGGVPTGLVPTALEALQSTVPLRSAPVAMSERPMMGANPTGAAFLGRVIVELWKDGPVVGVFGSDSKLLEHAIKHLSSLNRQPGQF